VYPTAFPVHAFASGEAAVTSKNLQVKKGPVGKTFSTGPKKYQQNQFLAI